MTQEESLIREARAGHSGAFDALVTPHLPRFYRLAFLITRDEEAAADAVQEALLRAYRGLRNLRDEAQFRPWCTRILVNEASKQMHKWRRLLLFFTGEAPLHKLPTAEAPEAILQVREEQAELWEAVQRLSTAHRTVLVLRYWEELSEAEMATVLGIPPGTVKSRLYHARAALERALRRQEPVTGETSSLRPALRGGESHD